jgi:UDP-N-acetylmuramoylalanine--D-glutamate ligase
MPRARLSSASTAAKRIVAGDASKSAPPNRGVDESPVDGSPADWTARRVTLMGLGRHGGGLGAARYLAAHGARLTISDTADRDALAEMLARLSDVPLARLSLGGHDESDFRGAEFIVVNPAVRPQHPCLQIARANGAILTSEIELFLQRCPAHVVGVTGSNGKSTTCSMLAAMLTADGRRVWLGGNIGGSLLGELGRMTAADWVVLELSSFQLAHLSERAPLPAIAVVTGCTPNHLDWHGSFDAYRRAKQRIVCSRPADSLVVLNPWDQEVASWAALAHGRTARAWSLDEIPPLAVAGIHNRHNAACAAAAAQAAGASAGAIRDALSAFGGLKHRLQWVATVAGRRIFNDSKATTPEATMAALAALEGDIWLVAGGSSKGASFDAVARAIISRARGAAFFGATRDELLHCLQSQRAGFNCLATERLGDALDWCWRQSRAGDAIVLSPACASHDQFHDFQERGEMFCRMARDIETRAPRATKE